MAKLTERYVQDCALNHLEEYYKAKNPEAQIFARTELVTTYKKKRGRADGLVAFKSKNGRIYTASLEAKSHKTYDSLKNIPRDIQLLVFLVVSFVIVTTITWFVLGTISWWLKILIALTVGLILSVGILMFFSVGNILIQME